MNKGTSWSDFRKSLNLTEADEEAVRLEKSVHSPQVDTIIRILKPLDYTLAVVPDNNKTTSVQMGIK